MGEVFSKVSLAKLCGVRSCVVPESQNLLIILACFFHIKRSVVSIVQRNACGVLYGRRKSPMYSTYGILSGEKCEVPEEFVLSDVHIPRMRASNGQKRFIYRGAKVWNDLDSETKLTSNIQCFKSRLKDYMAL